MGCSACRKHTHFATRCWDAQAADIFAETRFRLLVTGKSLADMDLMIAAHAISLGAILVTNNIRHFGRLAPELAIENWVDGDR
jgi:tRNA(fMet)-specific endonuclease VapC